MDQGASKSAAAADGHPGNAAPAKKRTKTPRPGSTYRANGGGRVKGRWRAAPEVFKDGSYRGSISLNRSQHSPWAPTYARARELSPSTEPVR